MKILIVQPAFWIYGGAEKVIVKLANYLIEHNHEVTILTTQMIPEVKKDLTDTRLLECKDFQEMTNILHAISQDFDVINVHNEPCHLMNFPQKNNVVWNCNEPPNQFADGGHIPFAEIEMVRDSIKKFVVADEFNKKRLMEIYTPAILDNDLDIEINPYGVDYEFWSEKPTMHEVEEMHYKIRQDPKNFYITQTAFIAPTKNQIKTVQIFAEVKKKIPNAKLVLAGYDRLPYRQEVENEAFKLGVHDDIIITGVLTQEEVRALYSFTNILLMPVKSQGSWLTVFEAMSAGVPVVTSKEFTASDILYQKNIGAVCDSMEEYVETITHPWGDSIHSEEAKDFVRNELTWELFCERMVKIYGEVMAHV